MTYPMPVDLDALEALLAKASPGEWTASSHDWFALRTHALIICDRPPVFYAESHAAWPDNSVAIAALHNAAPALIAELRELRVVIRVVRLALERALRERDKANLWKAEYIRQVTEKDEQCAEAHALLFKAEADRDDARAEAARLREANRWRPIAEGGKDNAGIEAIDSRTGFVRVVEYYKGYAPNWIPCWMLQGASNECYPLDYFTHYRPIPHPPESK